MNVTLLIDAIVRQTTVLVAQLATQAGTRATLSHTANQVFIELVRALKEQGLGNKVIADMFGLSLRTYHNRMARLAESGTVRGQSLWEALLSFVAEHGTVSRNEVLAHFRSDDVTLVGGVLKDLVDSGLVFRSGKGEAVTFKVATADDLSVKMADLGTERLAQLVWVAVSRFGPLTRQGLVAHVPLDDEQLHAALSCLEREGRIRYEGQKIASDHCIIPLEEPLGWEAALFDHYQAVVTAVATKLRQGRRQAERGEPVGGSTYTFDLWKGHPCASEVLGLLQELRDRAVAVRERVEAVPNATVPERDRFRVIAYVGQTVVGLDDEEEEER